METRAQRGRERASRAARLLAMCAAFSACTDAAERTDPPRPCGHAHNDFAHARPLLDSLEHDFCSVEADVHLVEGELLVAHDREEAVPSRTLESLYLDPLLARFLDGTLPSPRGRPLVLLVCLNAAPIGDVYAALDDVLVRYEEMLASFDAGRAQSGAVQVIVTGDIPRATIAEQTKRYVAIDGDIGDLDSTESSELVPLVSDNWFHHFSWAGGLEPMPPDQRAKLRDFVQRAHVRGRRLRLWRTPDTVEVWRELRDAGIDLINTDDIPGLADFLSEAVK